MKKAPSIDEQRARLNAVRQDPSSLETVQALRDALGSKSAALVSRGAQLAAELGHASLAPDMVQAFERFIVNPAKADPGCTAKNALLEALQRLEHVDPEVYLKGIRHVQREPVWGGTEDTAAGLRGIAALGLVQCRYFDVGVLLVDLLADPEKPARIAAARALGDLGQPEGVPLLRLKLLHGDPELEVMAECFASLLSLSAEAVPFVGRFLEAPPPLQRAAHILPRDPDLPEVAAMALGQSRRPEAFVVLRETFEARLEPVFRQVLLTAMALLRLPTAMEFLVSVIAEGGRAAAAGAVTALTPFLFDETLRTRVVQAVDERGEAAVAEVLQKALAGCG